MSGLPFTAIHFDDVDLFSEWERALGWDVESTQLSRGKMKIEFDHVELGELMVSNFRVRRAMHNTFATPEGTIIIVIGRVKRPLIWCGREFAPSLMGISRLSSEQWATHPEDWDCYEFVTTEALIRRLEIFPPTFLAKTTRVEDAFLPLMEPETGLFLRRMDVFFQKFRHANGRSDDLLHKAVFFDFVINGLQRVVDAGLAARDLLPRSTRRADIIPKAQELMQAHLEGDFTADDLAQSLGVSYRVLNYAFQDALGMSPYQYFLTEKLHAARRLLKTSNVSVLDAMTSLGFSTPSRFARRYERLFGELPSHTRKAYRAH